ncbi:MAG: outer membrane beta-barrel protein [Bacteroidales bacterium]|jgi:hypothetical protein
MKKLVFTLMIISLVSRGKAQEPIDRATDRPTVTEEMESGTLYGEMPSDTLDISFRDNYGYTNYDHTGERQKAGQPTNVTKEDETVFSDSAGEKSPAEEPRTVAEEETAADGNKPKNFREYIAKSQDKSDKPKQPNQEEEEKTTIRDVVKKWNSNRKMFKGHWVGFGGGFSNYLASDLTLTMPAEIDYMTLNSGKSFNYHLNFTQLSVGLTRHIGFVTGLGLSWDNFRFEGQNNIQKNEGAPNSEFLFADPANNSMIKKSTLNVAYLQLPVMFEIQIPAGWSILNFSAGPFGAIKVGSWSKIVMKGGEVFKNDSDFNFNMLMAGATARIGFGYFQAYANYYMTPLFLENKAPGGENLYVFDVGLAISF